MKKMMARIMKIRRMLGLTLVVKSKGLVWEGGGEGTMFKIWLESWKSGQRLDFYARNWRCMGGIVNLW